MQEKLRGIVIRETPKGETSKLLTVLTAEHGVITMSAKGARKLTSRLLRACQLFAFSEMVVYEKNGYYTLTEASVIADFFPIRMNIKSYSLAAYFCEVATAFTVPGEDSVAIMRLLLNSLYALESDKCPTELLKAAFELRICAEGGFLPELSVCDDCGDELVEGAFLSVNGGVSYCARCSARHESLYALSPDAQKAAFHITESDMARFLSFRIGEHDRALLAACAERYLLAYAERGFSTLTFYKHCEELK